MSDALLEAFFLRVRKKGQRKKFAPLGSFNGKNSVSAYILDKLKTYRKQKHYEPMPIHEKCFKVEKLFTKSPIHGVVKFGRYGRENDIIEIKTGGSKYRKRKEDTDPTPHFFAMYLPPTFDRGIVLMQKVENTGLRQVFENVIKYPFEEDFEGYKLELKPLLPEEVVAEYVKKGRARVYRFIRHDIPSDITDTVAGFNKKIEGSIEFAVKPQGGLIPKQGILDLIRGKTTPKKVFEFDDFDYDEIKIVVELEGGRRKTVNFSRLGTLRTDFDISEEIEIGFDGYPKLKSMRREALPLLTDLAKKAGLLK